MAILDIHRSALQFIRSLVVLFACALAAAALADQPKRIVAVGDIHGDYGAFERVMMRAGLMDKAGAWTGGDTVLMQNGDLSDRGPDTLKIIRALRALQDEAPKHGGKVISLVGNHEALNMIGDLRYVHPGEIEAFRNEGSEAAREAMFAKHRDAIVARYRKKDASLTVEQVKQKWRNATPLGLAEHQQAWSPDGEIGAWMVGNPAIVIIGDNLFVHGGVSAKYTQYSVDEINAMVSKALRAQTRSRKAAINDSLGPLWYRKLLRKSGETYKSGVDGATLTLEQELDLVLNHFGVKRIIIGHSRNITGIKPNHNNRVIQIDTGMSAYYKGVNSFLEITPDGIFADNEGVVTPIGE